MKLVRFLKKKKFSVFFKKMGGCGGWEKDSEKHIEMKERINTLKEKVIFK